MKKYFRRSLVLLILVVSFLGGKYLGYKEGAFDASTIRDITEASWASHKLNFYDEGDYGKAYEMDCKHYYSCVYNLYTLKERGVKSFDNDIVNHIIKNGVLSIKEKPESLNFLNTDLMGDDELSKNLLNFIEANRID